MSYQVHSSRRIPPRGDSRKRKEREEEYGSFKQPSSAPSALVTTMAKPMGRSSSTTQPVLSSNRLLAGYMAYEFITRGTLLGQECCAAAAQTASEPRRWGEADGAAEPIGKAKAKEAGSGEGAKLDTYGEVATLLKTDGAHIPGIVNPTQLARWIQMRGF